MVSSRTDVAWELEWLVSFPGQRTRTVEAVSAGPAESLTLPAPRVGPLTGAPSGAVVGLWLVGRALESGVELTRSPAPLRRVGPDGTTLLSEDDYAVAMGWPDGVEVHPIELEDAGPAVHHPEEVAL